MDSPLGPRLPVWRPERQSRGLGGLRQAPSPPGRGRPEPWPTATDLPRRRQEALTWVPACCFLAILGWMPCWHLYPVALWVRGRCLGSCHRLAIVGAAWPASTRVGTHPGLGQSAHGGWA
jgi:hypothetical protein